MYASSHTSRNEQKTQMSTGYTDNRRQNNLLHKQETETPSNCTIRVSSLLRPHHRPHRACCSATTAIYKTYWHIYIGTKRTRSGLGREFIMGATQNDETRHSTNPPTQGGREWRGMGGMGSVSAILVSRAVPRWPVLHHQPCQSLNSGSITEVLHKLSSSTSHRAIYRCVYPSIRFNRR